MEQLFYTSTPFLILTTKNVLLLIFIINTPFLLSTFGSVGMFPGYLSNRPININLRSFSFPPLSFIFAKGKATLRSNSELLQKKPAKIESLFFLFAEARFRFWR